LSRPELRPGWEAERVRPAFLFIVVLLLASTSGCSTGSTATPPAGHLHLTDVDNGRNFTVDLGTEVMIVVASNNADYSWTIMQPAADILVMHGKSVYVPPLSEDATLNRSQVFLFDTVRAGNGQLLLGYQNLAQPETLPKLTYRVDLTVQ
jgi:predicted secreted protein